MDIISLMSMAHFHFSHFYLSPSGRMESNTVQIKNGQVRRH